MTTTCCVSKCLSTKHNTKLFHFPRNGPLRDLWLTRVIPHCAKLTNLTPQQVLHCKVCIKHFETQYLLGNQKKLISCPTLFTDEEISSGIPSNPVQFASMRPDHEYCKSEIDHTYSKKIVDLNTLKLMKISQEMDTLEATTSKTSYTRKLHTDSLEMSESDDGLTNAKREILQLFSRLDDVELDSIEQWICGQSYKKDLKQMKALQKTEYILQNISNTIKEIVPFEGEMPSETIIPPTIGSSSDCNEMNTCHIDEFLYDEDELEKLVDNGKIKRNYCLDCNSRNVKPLIFTSHSMSISALQYIFKVMLPKDLEDKQILDVGSRIGAVLYGAYFFSNVSNIVGIEMNKECCDVQERIISQYSMDNNRIKVVHSDVMERSDIVTNSDIIVINILDFFVNVEKQKQMWYFFKKYIKKGSYLVCNRSMSDTLEMLDLSEELLDWLSICKPHQLENEIFFCMEDYGEIFLYTIN